MKSILVLIHCESNTGYAIGQLERVFYEMALPLCDGDRSRVHFAYPSMRNGPSPTLPADFNQYLIIDPSSADSGHHEDVVRQIRKRQIDTLLGFDQPVARPIYGSLRRGGVRSFTSYWGAPMSRINPWHVLLLKRIEVALRRHGPDHYIFESAGMRDTAVFGRGIRRSRTSIVPLGVDTGRFHPDPADARHVYQRLGISPDRRIFFFSGHMEPRKGIAVIMQAANRLASRRRENDWHIVLCGNKGEEHLPYLAMLDPRARAHVTFGGYRADLDLLLRGCYAAIIASTGWDSFTMSALEMQASGLPLLVSDISGLRETVEDQVSGLHFPPGDVEAAAAAMERLLDDPVLRDHLGAGARRRIEQRFDLSTQIGSLSEVVRRVACASAPQR